MLILSMFYSYAMNSSTRPGTDRTNVCWVKEGCNSLKPKSCGRIPLEVVESPNSDPDELNLYLNTGCYSQATRLQAQLDNAPASCNPPCFRIKEPGEYCYMSTRNNNFSNRRHMGQITVRRPLDMSVATGTSFGFTDV